MLDVDRLANRIGADQRGLGALEHLLYSGDDPFGGAPQTVGTVGALDDPRRCEYSDGVATVIAQEAALLAAGWTDVWDGGEPYREQLAADEGDGLDSLVNDALFLLESITDLELGAALGAMGGSPKPESIDEGPAAAGVEDLLPAPRRGGGCPSGRRRHRAGTGPAARRGPDDTAACRPSAEARGAVFRPGASAETGRGGVDGHGQSRPEMPSRPSK